MSNPHSSQLTPAEAQVAALAAGGMTNREIARLLGRAESTVKNQLNAIYRKGAGNHGPVNRNELRYLYGHQAFGSTYTGDAHGSYSYYQRARLY